MTRFIIVSGLPASGKSTLGRAIAQAMDLPFIDKDDILERLFDEKGGGDADWRRSLSRASDDVLQAEVTASGGAVVTSFWHVAGMADDSGTPTDWLAQLPGALVNLHCQCPPRVAALRFSRRVRRAEHLDQYKTHDEILNGLEALAALGPPSVGELVPVDMSVPPILTAIVGRIESAFAQLAAREGQ